MFGLRWERFATGWRGVCLIAVTYVYFLIFAQFAFLKRLAQLGIADSHLQLVMDSMAVGGIGFSLLASRKLFEARPRVWLQVAFLLCGAAAMCTLLPLTVSSSAGVALLIGCGLGLLTVTLVSNLRLWIGTGDALVRVGLGTGLGYFICNIPMIFAGTPQRQAVVAAVLCLLGIGAAWSTVEPASVDVAEAPRSLSFPRVLMSFTALVWLDSAAFFIIQSTPSLKSGTWEGTLHLWANGVIHLSAALFSAYLLRKRGLSFVLGLAVLALSVACLLLHATGMVMAASLFYPAGVSLYSVALVAYPSLLGSAGSSHERAWRAALIYAVAGWFGSAMGIGMGQHLMQVPIAFIVLAAALVLGAPLLRFVGRHRREAAVVAAGVIAALLLQYTVTKAGSHKAPATQLTAAARGRGVYISEGCISCHSQYVRPNTPDVMMWGPVESLEELRAQHPPLIGNRRQGPDLSQVGGRRSQLWLKAHFMNPAEVSHASFMPSYAYLFQDSLRGTDLLAYLGTLKSPRYAEHIALEHTWSASPEASAAASAGAGAHLFGMYCSTCHAANGKTRLTWASSFARLPPDMERGAWVHVPGAAPSPERRARLAEIIKFGIPGSDMPGHEYLSDRDVSSIALWLDQSRVAPGQFASLPHQSGENQ